MSQSQVSAAMSSVLTAVALLTSFKTCFFFIYKYVTVYHKGIAYLSFQHPFLTMLNYLVFI